MSTLHNRSKHGPQQSGMTHAQWRAAQRVRSGAHWFFQYGTYNVGRNKDKREDRARRRRYRA